MLKKIREKNCEQIKQIAAIEEMNFSNPLSETQLFEMSNNPNYEIWVIIEEKTVLSYIVAAFVCGDCQILSVAAKIKSSGYGKKVFLGFLKNVIANTYFLEVRKSNQVAIELYKAIGFKVDGIRKNLYKNPPDDGLIMHMEGIL